MKRLLKVDILSMDGFFQGDSIYVSQVRYKVKQIKVSKNEREKILVAHLVELGATKADAELYVILNSFSTGLVEAVSGGNGSGDTSIVFTENLRFGKGDNGWFYLPEKEIVNTSNDSYGTPMQDWVKKYGYSF
jgi:hypothetical protein